MVLRLELQQLVQALHFELKLRLELRLQLVLNVQLVLKLRWVLNYCPLVSHFLYQKLDCIQRLRCLLELPVLEALPSLLAAAAMFLALRSSAAMKDLLRQPRQQLLPPTSQLVRPKHAANAPLHVSATCAAAAALPCNAPLTFAAQIWTPALAELSGYSVADVSRVAADVQEALARGVVVGHNIHAKAKEEIAKAAAAARGDAAPIPRP